VNGIIAYQKERSEAQLQLLDQVGFETAIYGIFIFIARDVLSSSSLKFYQFDFRMNLAPAYVILFPASS
jgi:hypothetical protein